MTSVAEVEANVHVVGVEGSSDDLDVPIEACFRDAGKAEASRAPKSCHRICHHSQPSG